MYHTPIQAMKTEDLARLSTEIIKDNANDYWSQKMLEAYQNEINRRLACEKIADLTEKPHPMTKHELPKRQKPKKFSEAIFDY